MCGRAVPTRMNRQQRKKKKKMDKLLHALMKGITQGGVGDVRKCIKTGVHLDGYDPHVSWCNITLLFLAYFIDMYLLLLL